MLFLLVFSLLCVVTASPWPGPSATVPAKYLPESLVAITPTLAPDWRAELARRATTSSSFTGWELDVCGWETGDYKSIFSCPSTTDTCLWNSRLSIVGCGNTVVLPHYTSCVNFNSSTCDGSCSANPNIMKCSGFNDNCYTIKFPDGYTMPTCGYTANMSKTIGLTYGGVPTPIFLPRYLGANNVLTIETQFPEGYTTKSSSTSSVTSPAQSKSPDVSGTPGKKSNIGPIIGGVVGGLGLLIAIAVGVWVFMRRKKRRTESLEQSEPLQKIDVPLGPQELGGNPKTPYHHELG